MAGNGAAIHKKNDDFQDPESGKAKDQGGNPDSVEQTMANENNQKIDTLADQVSMIK